MHKFKKKMRALILIIFISYLIGSCTSKDYFQLAEKEINDRIEEKLSCDNKSFYPELENYFEQYVIKNGLVKDTSDVGNIYYQYLLHLLTSGGGIDNITENKTLIKLRNELWCAGYNITRRQNSLFLHNCFEPIISKYKLELIKENKEEELIYRIGSSNPNEEVSLTIVCNGLLTEYEPNEFNNPVMKKFIILFFFVQFEMQKKISA